MNLILVYGSGSRARLITPPLTGTLLPGAPLNDRQHGGAPSPVTTKLRDALLGIQFGTEPDPYGWIHKIC